MIRRFLTAVAFLTRIPINPKQPFDGSDVARATVFFPLLGCLIAGLVIVTMYFLAQMSVSPSLQALAATAVVALIGGGLHQDGLADMADGFGGGHTTEDVLRIMRDSTIGTYGGIALFLSLSIRVIALAELSVTEIGWRWIIVAAVVSRCSIWLGWLMPYARASGTGAAITQFAGPLEVTGASVFTLVVGWTLIGTDFNLAILLAVVVFLVIAWLCHRRIRGITGDTMGATTEVTEVILLAAGATIASANMMSATL